MGLRGPKPIGAAAMTPAERARRWRLKNGYAPYFTFLERITKLEAELANTKQAVAKVQAMLATKELHGNEQEQAVPPSP